MQVLSKLFIYTTWVGSDIGSLITILAVYLHLHRIEISMIIRIDGVEILFTGLVTSGWRWGLGRRRRRRRLLDRVEFIAIYHIFVFSFLEWPRYYRETETSVVSWRWMVCTPMTLTIHNGVGCFLRETKLLTARPLIDNEIFINGKVSALIIILIIHIRFVQFDESVCMIDYWILCVCTLSNIIQCVLFCLL